MSQPSSPPAAVIILSPEIPGPQGAPGKERRLALFSPPSPWEHSGSPAALQGRLCSGCRPFLASLLRRSPSATGWREGAASRGKGTVPVCHSPRRPHGPLLLLEERQGCLRGSLAGTVGREGRKDSEEGRGATGIGCGWRAWCGAACVHTCLCFLQS